MGIATLDALLAGMRPPEAFYKGVTPATVAGRPQSLWYLAGTPGVGAAVANTAGGVALSSSSAQVAGQIRHVDPGGSDVSVLARLVGSSSAQPGHLLLCDRLMQITGNSSGAALSVTSTSSQTINSNALPARDVNGSINGDGVLWAMEVAATVGAGTPTMTIGYTDQDGNTGATANNVDPIASANSLGAFYRFGLAAGDTGIRSVQSYQATATMTSGTISLVAYRILADLELVVSGVPNAVDALTSGMAQLQNGAVPFLVFIPSTTTATAVSGHFIESQG